MLSTSKNGVLTAAGAGTKATGGVGSPRLGPGCSGTEGESSGMRCISQEHSAKQHAASQADREASVEMQELHDAIAVGFTDVSTRARMSNQMRIGGLLVKRA